MATPLLLSDFKKGDQMKTAINTKLWAQPKPKPPAHAPTQLAGIKVKDYSLLGFRDTEAERETHEQLDFLKSKYAFSIPRLYTLVSRNRKIPLKETLSNPSRIFLNFESFKWSELFFTFFRSILSERSEHFAFKNLLYSLDLYVCHYQLVVMAIKNSSQHLNGAFHRHKNQFQLISMLRNHQQGENLFLLFILDLLLISIGRGHFTSCSFMMTQAEALILLNYFSSQDLITVESDKLHYSSDKLNSCLRKYFEFRGQILLTKRDKNIFCEKQISSFKKIFEKNEAVLEHKTFETCFTHI